jgi:hypothetical protein
VQRILLNGAWQERRGFGQRNVLAIAWVAHTHDGAYRRATIEAEVIRCKSFCICAWANAGKETWSQDAHDHLCVLLCAIYYFSQVTISSESPLPILSSL